MPTETVSVPRSQLVTLCQSLALKSLLPGEGEALINCWIRAADAAPTPPLGGQGSSDLRPDTQPGADGAVVARLTAALTPFAAMIGHIDDHYDDHDSPDWTPFIPVGAYRAAYAALTAVSTDTQPGTSAFASDPNMTPPSADSGVREVLEEFVRVGDQARSRPSPKDDEFGRGVDAARIEAANEARLILQAHAQPAQDGGAGND